MRDIFLDGADEVPETMEQMAFRIEQAQTFVTAGIQRNRGEPLTVDNVTSYGPVVDGGSGDGKKKKGTQKIKCFK